MDISLAAVLVLEQPSAVVGVVCAWCALGGGDGGLGVVQRGGRLEGEEMGS